MPVNDIEEEGSDEQTLQMLDHIGVIGKNASSSLSQDDKNRCIKLLMETH